MGKKKKSREHSVSGGGRKAARINSQVRRLEMKIKRWERYTEEIKAGQRSGSASRWNTVGLKKHMELLKSLV